MRHTRIGRYVPAITVALLGAMLLFAGWRQRDGTEPVSEDQPSTPGATSDWQERGRQVYDAECRSCHGSGEKRGPIPAFGPLMAAKASEARGRADLVELLLTGEVRRVEQGEVVTVPNHPPFDHLSDHDLAALLNHMLVAFPEPALGPTPPKLYEPADIAALRR